MEVKQTLAAGGAAVAAALVSNPFDVVKTRIQTQAALRAMTSGIAMPNVASELSCGCPSHGVPTCPNVRLDECGVFRGTFDALRKLVRQEGMTVLWRGTPASLAMAVPQVGIYLPAYEMIRNNVESASGSMGHILPEWSPALVAGTTARGLAVLITSPLELARTRAQAFSKNSQHWAKGKNQPGIITEIRKASRFGIGGMGSLWKGTMATLARDVPFSGIYWVAAEKIRRAATVDSNAGAVGNIAITNLIAGSGGGALAAIVTTPLDVVKTRIQIDTSTANSGQSNMGIPRVTQMLAKILREEGVSHLFSGTLPRAARAAPSCAIVLTSYELLKKAMEYF